MHQDPFSEGTVKRLVFHAQAPVVLHSGGGMDGRASAGAGRRMGRLAPENDMAFGACRPPPPKVYKYKLAVVNPVARGKKRLNESLAFSRSECIAGK